LDPVLTWSLDPNSQSVSGSRRAKWPTKIENSAGCSFLRNEGFSCIS
jgi:hypothetical protein